MSLPNGPTRGARLAAGSRHRAWSWVVAWCVALGCGGTPSTALAAVPSPHREFQLWSELDFKMSLGPGSGVVIPAMVRLGTQSPNPALRAVGTIVNRIVSAHLDVSAGYLRADPPRASGGIPADIPLVAATVHLAGPRTVVSDRNRVEKLYGLRGSPARYRNRLVVDRRLGSGRCDVFLADEAFCDLHTRRWNQNRAQIGAGFRPLPNATLEVSYVLRSTSDPYTGTRDVLGLTLGIEWPRLR